MRIIAGQWRGRKLTELGSGDVTAHLRPSSDRFRESLFNILRSQGELDEISKIRVLDLFAGTGALGLEALSRGAKFATFVENGKTSQKIIRDNIHHLNCAHLCELLPLDVTKLGICKTEPYQLIFLDPPYSKGLGERAIESAIKGGWIADGAIVVWEEELAPRLAFHLKPVDERKIGRAYLTIARFEGV